MKESNISDGEGQEEEQKKKKKAQEEDTLPVKKKRNRPKQNKLYLKDGEESNVPKSSVYFHRKKQKLLTSNTDKHMIGFSENDINSTATNSINSNSSICHDKAAIDSVNDYLPPIYTQQSESTNFGFENEASEEGQTLFSEINENLVDVFVEDDDFEVLENEIDVEQFNSENESTSCSNEMENANFISEERVEANIMRGESVEQNLLTGERVVQNLLTIENSGEELYGEIRNLAEYYKKYEVLNEKCRLELEIKGIEVILLVHNFLSRHKGTDVMAEDLLKMISFILEVHHIPTNRKIFAKLLTSDVPVTFHFFCTHCFFVLNSTSSLSIRKPEEMTCPMCDTKSLINNLSAMNYFVTISMIHQIRTLLQDPKSDLRRSLADENFRKNNNGKKGDIFDGSKYIQLQEKFGEELFLTYNMNTDGAVACDSGIQKSIWPIQLYLNEIKKENRFSLRNIILAGLWFNAEEPSMEIFLSYFVKEAREMETNGIKWKDEEGKEYVTKIVLLASCLDSMARFKLQKIISFHGYFGCGYCKHPGILVNLKTGEVADDHDDENNETEESKGAKQVRFCWLDEIPMRRQNEEMRAQMFKYAEKKQSIEGIKSVSPLIVLEHFDLANGFPVDYLHNGLLGVAEDVTSFFFDSKYHNEDFYIGNKISEIDAKILQLRFPFGLCRLPVQLSKRSCWKATDWRNWLLYTSLPILVDYLPLQYYQHYTLFVNAIYILLQDSISEEEIRTAEQMLKNFVLKFEQLYGKKHMVYNIHLLLHLGDTVRNYGPLWTVSTFIFESGNGYFLKLAHGTVGFANQIVSRHIRDRTITTEIVKYYSISEKVKKFCDSINFLPPTNAIETELSVKILKYMNYKHDFNEIEKNVLARDLKEYNIKTANAYIGFIKNGIKYHTTSYKRCQKTNNTVIYLSTNEYAIIEGIFGVNGNIVLYVNIVKTLNHCMFQLEDFTALASHIKPCVRSDVFRIIPFSLVLRKCIPIEFDKKLYIADFCNHVELRD